MKNDDSDDDYRVGPGKPPKHTRFKRGQSGNPNGRPKVKVSFQAVAERELMRLVTVPENGKARRRTKQQMVVQSVIHRAIKGDHKASELVFRTFGQTKEIESSAAGELPTADPDMLKRIKARLNRMVPED
jgi:hypothetical protein